MRRVIRYVERLILQRRPRSFVPTDDEAGALRVAILLRSARPENAMPQGEFITALRRRLAEQASRTGEAPLGRSSLFGRALRLLGLARPGPAGADLAAPGLPVRRRRALIAGVSTAAVAGAAVAVAVDRTVGGGAPSRVPGPTLEPNAATWQTVMRSEDLPEGAVRPFDTGAVTGFAMRTAGGLSARSGTCTHQGCRLRFRADVDQLACPCHRTLFALDGTVVQWQMPTPPPRLPAIQIRESGEDIQVLVPPP